MISSVFACSLFGIESFAVTVEVGVRSGEIPKYSVVGLPHTCIREAGVRIRAALGQVGHPLPSQQITVNLAPANRPKQSAALDLAIAVGILRASKSVPADAFHNYMFVGELGLNGTIRSVPGILSAALLARRRKLTGLIVPADCVDVAAMVDGIDVQGAEHLSDVISALRGDSILTRCHAEPREPERSTDDISFGDIRGQTAARRALEIAVAGAHNILFLGPPGIGKTMLARSIPSILPTMTKAEALETAQIVSSTTSEMTWTTIRPFRSPHHSTSRAAMLGGGSPPRPGEVSLAHNGVLFLDEVLEFPRYVLEGLRQPLEDRRITVARASGILELPASFLLIASANPCPCGWFASKIRSCQCSARTLDNYRRRLSGPLLDRIDLRIYVPAVPTQKLRQPPSHDDTNEVRSRIARARAVQQARFGDYGPRSNAEISAKLLHQTCELTPQAEHTLQQIAERHQPTARGVTRIIKVARTISDLSGHKKITDDAILEASLYRDLDKASGTDWV